MEYPFRFKVNIFDYDFDEELKQDTGLGMCTSYADAAAKLEERYGHTLVSIEKLALLEDNTLIHLPEEICEKYAKEEYITVIPAKKEK